MSKGFTAAVVKPEVNYKDESMMNVSESGFDTSGVDDPYKDLSANRSNINKEQNKLNPPEETPAVLDD